MTTIDLTLISIFLGFVVLTGFFVAKKSHNNLNSFFLADRSLPWWWAGSSIAATTFAADTPLAISGIMAAKGLSGNWVWFSWALLHASVIFIYAKMIRRSSLMTDAELIALRYSGQGASVLRTTRALLYGVVMNSIILGWVLKAMVKILKPFIEHTPHMSQIFSISQQYIPNWLVLGSAAETIIIIGLVFLVATYSMAGGLKGVVITDLVQLSIALVGSYILAYETLAYVGGLEGLHSSLQGFYGVDHTYLDLFPQVTGTKDTAWLGLAFLVSYLFIQAYANNPADGGGYFFQRIGACKNEHHAQKGMLFFFYLHYIIRLWPWVIVGLGALVIFPIGSEAQNFGGNFQFVSADREMAYPAMILALLGPGVTGILLISLLSAFMSTIDTHINWGASYIVNDIYTPMQPKATAAQKIKVARYMVLAFSLLAIFSACQIERIEKAWQLLAGIGAGLIFPTALRWLWWRINTLSEIMAIFCGVSTAIYLETTQISYEKQLLIIGIIGALACILGAFIGPKVQPDKLRTFEKRIGPSGLWHNNPKGKKILCFDIALTANFCFGFVLTLYGGSQLLKLHYFSAIAYVSSGLLVMLTTQLIHRKQNRPEEDQKQSIAAKQKAFQLRSEHKVTTP